MSDQAQVLESYPPSYCSNCEKDTGYDGWGMGIGGQVDFYCLDCGKKKGTKSFSEIFDRTLRQEIVEVITYG